MSALGSIRAGRQLHFCMNINSIASELNRPFLLCQGTVIRVFSIPEGDRLFEFRRGMKGVEIYSLAFDTGNQYLVSSSNTGTVHIFKLVAMSTET